MTHDPRIPAIIAGSVRIFVLVLFLCAPLTCAAKQPPKPETALLHNIYCRIVSRTNAPAIVLTTLVDADLDTMSASAGDYTVGTTIPGNRKLAASVRHVDVNLPRDRFNVNITLDGKTHLRLNHMDLDIYVETVIDESTYILHCSPAEEEIAVVPDKGKQKE